MNAFEITLAKAYGEIGDYCYIDDVVEKLRHCRLINGKQCEDIRFFKTSVDKNRCMIRTLVKVIHDNDDFKRLCAVLLSEDQYKQLAGGLITVYCILKFEKDILEQLKYPEIFCCLKEKKFFKQFEELLLPARGEHIEQIMMILKEKCMQYFTDFLKYLNELPNYSPLVLKIQCEINVYKELPSTALHSQPVSSGERILIGNPTDNTCGDCATDIQVFQQYLKQKYELGSFNSTYSGSEVFHFNLALVETSDKEYHNFWDCHSLLYEKESSKTLLNSYSDIFVEGHRVVVLQGPPGCGKTTLAKHLCKQWATGSLLQIFTHVVFVPLRDKQVASLNGFDQLIKLFFDISMSESVAKEIFKVHGKDILIILEGWDELPEERRSYTLFSSLISGSVLPCAIIAVTTRSSAIASLPSNTRNDLSCRRIEILGFTQEQVYRYVDQHFHRCNSPLMIAQFWDQLKNLPYISNILFVPVNLCIILQIFIENDHRMPQTYTELYVQYLLSQLSVYHNRRFEHCANFKSFDCLPTYILKMLHNFGKMAYQCLMNNKLTFTEKEISDECFNSEDIPLELDESGILEPQISLYATCESKTYQFVHRTIQELLAAWYLSQQTEAFQLRQLKAHFNKKESESIWMFYAGLTKSEFNVSRILPKNYLQRFKNFCSCSLVRQFPNAFKNLNVKSVLFTFFSAEYYGLNMCNCVSPEFQVTLMAAAMESQNPQVCKDISNSYVFCNGDTGWISVPDNAVTLQIMSALSYCIAHSGIKWVIQCKKLDNDNTNALLKYLTCDKSANCKCRCCSNFSERTDSNIFALDISNSQHTVNGLVRLVETQKYLKLIILSRCELVDDNLVIEVAKALEENTTLQMLHLFACNISGVGLQAIGNMLKKNTTLEWIGLRDNMDTLKEEDIILLLQTIDQYNVTVYMLILDNVFYTAPRVQEVLATLNANRNRHTGIEKLSLRLQDSIKWLKILSHLPFVGHYLY